VTVFDIPHVGSARVHVLHAGYAGLDGDDEHVVFSHHHPDRTLNAAPFPNAKIRDHWAIYDGDRWLDRDADGAVLPPAVRLPRTPGHSAKDISAITATADGTCACTRAWRSAEGPPTDPLGTDATALKASREQLLNIATVIIPGHGAPFRPLVRA
jgi:glyoxylase-like metal-dependent hydrolase (beta-lactamase superfamily II)